MTTRWVYVYDHAIFVTYSITFMMLLVTLASIVATFVPSRFVSPAMQIVAVAHMYRQLRGAYALSVAGVLLRLIRLLLSAAIVLPIFVVSLVLLGAFD